MGILVRHHTSCYVPDCAETTKPENCGPASDLKTDEFFTVHYSGNSKHSQKAARDKNRKSCQLRCNFSWKLIHVEICIGFGDCDAAFEEMIELIELAKLPHRFRCPLTLSY